jgi:NADPH2:quinone reductase
MSSIRAVVVDPSVPGRLVIRDFDYPSASPSEAIVQVKAISLNRGEVRTASMAEAGWRPGWDLAGVVEKEAADGSGPRAGARVVGMRLEGAWAEAVAVPTTMLAEIPESVSFAQAATLPIAGLTALWTLEYGGQLLDRRVLITGATGGVGHLACQLARHEGAHVTGVVRQQAHEAMVKEAGAHQVIVSEDLGDARNYGTYDLILDSVGGRTLANALALLAPGGRCVNFGVSGGTEVTFDLRHFFLLGGATLYGFIIFHELKRKSVSEGLDRLGRLVADGRLRPQIDVEAPWTQIGDVAQRLLNRSFTGKAVLHIAD